MTNTDVQDVTSGADRFKVFLAIALAVGGLVAYYVFATQPMAARIGMIVVGAVAGVALAWTSAPGQRLVAFLKDSVAEAKRVTWPSRKETIQMTGVVFMFSIVAALVLWATDKSLEVIIFDLLLGWKK
jgi:preprotein translocase subunit SecE